MSTLAKIENDCKTYVKRVDEAVAMDLEKIRSDLNNLRVKAAQYGSTP